MRRHKTIGTLRADGSPRISGIEAAFEDGELVFGSMPNARKGADLRRDPRFALHSATVDPVEGSEARWPGEAKISGRASYAGPTTEAPDGDRFAPTSLRLCTPTSTRRPRCSSSSGGRPRTGCAGSSASSPRSQSVRCRLRQTDGNSSHVTDRALSGSSIMLHQGRHLAAFRDATGGPWEAQPDSNPNPQAPTRPAFTRPIGARPRGLTFPQLRARIGARVHPSVREAALIPGSNAPIAFGDVSQSPESSP